MKYFYFIIVPVAADVLFGLGIYIMTFILPTPESAPLLEQYALYPVTGMILALGISAGWLEAWLLGRAVASQDCQGICILGFYVASFGIHAVCLLGFMKFIAPLPSMHGWARIAYFFFLLFNSVWILLLLLWKVETKEKRLLQVVQAIKKIGGPQQ